MMVSIHDIPLWFLHRTFIMLFPGCCCWIWLAEAKVGWCHIFHGKAHPQMLNISEQISLAVPTWASTVCEQTTHWYWHQCLRHKDNVENKDVTFHKRHQWYADFKDKLTVRPFPGDVTVFTSHSEPYQAHWSLTEQQQWPGKPGALPPILQRQRDVRGRWPFPANQRENLQKGKDASLHLCSGSDEASIFVLAHGGVAVPVSFLAESKDAEKYLLALYRK